MNHRYIDETSVAERYLRHGLIPDELAAFEAHLAGCEECSDRLLLAQIFLDEPATADRPHAPSCESVAVSSAPGIVGPNGAGAGERSVSEEPVAPLPREYGWPARFVAQFKTWQLVLILCIAAALLLLAPTTYYLWELARLRGAR